MVRFSPALKIRSSVLGVVMTEWKEVEVDRLEKSKDVAPNVRGLIAKYAILETTTS